MRILVTDATEYIGGRLVPRLLDAGHQVRCMVRDPGKLQNDPWRDRVEVVQGDILEPTSLNAALDGCEVAYYLVHSMDGAAGFADRDQPRTSVWPPTGSGCNGWSTWAGWARATICPNTSPEEDEEGTVLHQTAFFRPRGLLGRLYWLSLVPFHAIIFRLMAERIVATAETRPHLCPPGRPRRRGGMIHRARRFPAQADTSITRRRPESRTAPWPPTST